MKQIISVIAALTLTFGAISPIYTFAEETSSQAENSTDSQISSDTDSSEIEEPSQSDDSSGTETPDSSQAPDTSEKPEEIIRPTTQNTKLTFNAEKNSVVLKWNKTDNSYGYKLYKYDGKWKPIKTFYDSSSLTYRCKGLKSGTKYKFMLKTFVKKDGKTYFSSDSQKITAVTLPADTAFGKSYKKTDKSLTVNWKKVSGASGYRIYRYNYSSKKWQTAKTISNGKTTSLCLKSGIKPSTTYALKVRPYIKLNGRTCWGNYSKTAKFTTTAQAKSNCLYHIKCTTPVYNTALKSVGTLYYGGSYTGHFNPRYPDYVVINYMNSNVLVPKKNVSENTNAKVLETGTVGQMGGAIYGQASCGPTATAILVNSQKKENWNKDSLILYSENHGLNDQGSLRYGGGMTAPKLLNLINGFSGGKYKASNIYGSDPVSILKNQIDKGNRAIVNVQYTSYIVTHYQSGVHFIVICGYEYINGVLYFYYADPFYGNGPRSLGLINAGTLAASLNMIKQEPRCIITLC